MEILFLKRYLCLLYYVFIISGDRVMGLVSGGALGSTVEADPDFLWPVPDHWSLQDAATVPLPYAIAYYCLVSTFLNK